MQFDRIVKRRAANNPHQRIRHQSQIEQALAHGQALKLSAADIAPIPSSSYPTPARRPANSRLDCSAFEQAFAVHRPHWRAQLAAHFASRG